jgi:hypothetical protein
MTKKKRAKKEISGLVLGIAERGGRTRSLKIKSLTLNLKAAGSTPAFGYS